MFIAYSIVTTDTSDDEFAAYQTADENRNTQPGWTIHRYISDLAETNLDSDNGTGFWSERMAIYKLIGPLALDLLSAPTSQAFVEIIFSLSVA